MTSPASSTVVAAGSSRSSSPTSGAASTRISSDRHARESSFVGGARAAFARVARGRVRARRRPAAGFAGAAARAEAAWRDLGRPGRPRLWGQGYSLADVERGNAYLRDYYAFTVPSSNGSSLPT